MKKAIFIFFIMSCLFFKVNGQYSVNKEKYDISDYKYQKTDPYNPLVCGIASYFLPGLGQMAAGETKRGLIFTSIHVSSAATVFVGLILSPPKADNINNPQNVLGPLLILSGITVNIGNNIWSITDAVKVAKVNNLAARDQKGSFFKLEINPVYVDKSIGNSNEFVLGLSLKKSF